MPIEIRELVIRAVAIPEQKGAKDEAGEEHPSQAPDSPLSQEAIIQECVQQVLRILRKEKDR